MCICWRTLSEIFIPFGFKFLILNSSSQINELKLNVSKNKYELNIKNNKNKRYGKQAWGGGLLGGRLW
ncbi:hypothetical protein BpHYR1_027517 [Brachionus plicatilis]|uniref:Uncharacterized protein n=1 Tax=Brachionus plicatilis TaxID=10195 RepID=A0A3M7RYL8_BRAPC|nr:hypothetical protein BpHYR1_027517 [Brachionus plicatilis]